MEDKSAINRVHNVAKEEGFNEAVFAGMDEQENAGVFFEGTGKGIVSLIVDLVLTFHDQTGVPLKDLLSDIQYDATYAESMRKREKASLFDI